MVGRLQLHPAPQSRVQLRHRRADLASGMEKIGDEMVERNTARALVLSVRFADVHAGAASRFDPALLFELLVRRAYRVGMYFVPPRQLAGRRQAAAGTQVIT